MRKFDTKRNGIRVKILETGEEFNCLPDDFQQEKYLHLGTGKIEAVKEGDIFVLVGATMEIIETTGHTQGGISVYYKEKNLLFQQLQNEMVEQPSRTCRQKSRV